MVPSRRGKIWIRKKELQKVDCGYICAASNGQSEVVFEQRKLYNVCDVVN